MVSGQCQVSFYPKIFLSKPEGEKPEVSSTNDPEVAKEAKNQV